MAKNSVDEWSTDHTQNTDVGGVGILGSNVASNIDDAARRMMAQIAEYRDSSLIQTVQERIVTKALPYNLQRIRLFYPDPDDQYKLDTIEFVRMTKNNIDSAGIESAAYVRSLDRFIPGSDEPSTTNGGYWVNDTPVMKVNQFGTGFAAAQAAIKHHAIMGRILDFGKSGTVYENDVLEIPANSRFIGDARFEMDGTTIVDPSPADPETYEPGDGETTITIGDNFRAEILRIHTLGGATDQNQNLAVAGENFNVDHLEMTADSYRKRNGLHTGPNCRIGKLVSRLIDRPVATTGNYSDDEYCIIEDCDIDGYVRGIGATSLGYFALLRGRMYNQSPNASKDNGHNSILINGVKNVYVGDDVDLADSGEHTFRVGGGDVGENQTLNVYLGHITVRRAGGCPVKLNQNALYTEWFVCAGLTAIDCSQGGEGNTELFRVTRSRYVHIGYIRGFRSSTDWDLPRQAFLGNAVQNLYIGNIEGAYRGPIVEFNGTTDSYNVMMPDADRDSGPVENVVINLGNASTSAQALTRFAATIKKAGKTPMTVGNVHFILSGAHGWTDNIVAFAFDDPTNDNSGTFDPIELTGPITYSGFAGGDSAPTFGIGGESNVTPSIADVTVDIAWRDRRWVGRPDRIRNNASDAFLQIAARSGSAFDPSDTNPNGVFINNTGLTAGSGNTGMAIIHSRLGSTRRGAAQCVVQTGSLTRQTGYGFYVNGAGSDASDALSLAMLLKHSGVVNIPGLPTYADNSAALSGGLVAGDLYKTDSGDLRIVVSS